MNNQYGYEPQNSLTHRRDGRPRSFINTGLVLANIIVFLILDQLGDTTSAGFMLEHGASYPLYFLQGQYYLLFTSMFIHFGINHLFNNMLVLFFVGDNLERAVGHFSYLVIYIMSGLFAGGFSTFMMIYKQDYAVSGGASGAIFGMIGALVYVVILNKGRLEELTTRRLVFMIALTLYLGFTSPNVDNMAHIGGLVSGFFLAMLIYRKKPNRY